jgi:DNA repair exonuclease SbcCD ATPase subunit
MSDETLTEEEARELYAMDPAQLIRRDPQAFQREYERRAAEIQKLRSASAKLMDALEQTWRRRMNDAPDLRELEAFVTSVEGLMTKLEEGERAILEDPSLVTADGQPLRARDVRLAEHRQEVANALRELEQQAEAAFSSGFKFWVREARPPVKVRSADELATLEHTYRDIKARFQKIAAGPFGRPQALRELFHEAVYRDDRILAEAMARAGLEVLDAMSGPDGPSPEYQAFKRDVERWQEATKTDSQRRAEQTLGRLQELEDTVKRRMRLLRDALERRGVAYANPFAGAEGGLWLEPLELRGKSYGG